MIIGSPMMKSQLLLLLLLMTVLSMLHVWLMWLLELMMGMKVLLTRAIGVVVVRVGGVK